MSAGVAGARVSPRWRVVVVFTAAVLVSIAVHRGVDAVFGTGYSRGSHVARAVAGLVLYVGLVAAAQRWLDRRPLADVGLRPVRQGPWWLLVGAAAWLLPALAGATLCVALGWSRIALAEPLTAVAGVVALRLVLVVVMEAVPEELLFRGYLYGTIAQGWSPRHAVVGQALLFVLWGAASGAARTVDRLLLFAVFALVMGALRHRTGTVWTTIGFHTAFQTVAQATGPPETAFAIDDLATLQLVAYGAAPFALCVPVAVALQRALRGSREADVPSS